jgi:hypothetical protein
MKVQDVFERLGDVDGERPAPSHKRRRLRPLLAVVLAVIVASTAFVLVGDDGGARGNDKSDTSTSTSLAAVSRRTLR